MPYGSGSYGSIEYGGDIGPGAAPGGASGYDGTWWWGVGVKQIFLDLVYHRDEIKSSDDEAGET